MNTAGRTDMETRPIRRIVLLLGLPVVNAGLLATSVFSHFYAFRSADPSADPFDSPWMAAKAMTLIGFILTWPVAAISAVLLWRTQRTLACVVSGYLALVGLFLLYFLVNMARLLTTGL